MTHSGILANAKNSGIEIKTIKAERSFAIPGIMQLSIQRIFLAELHITRTKKNYLFYD